MPTPPRASCAGRARRSAARPLVAGVAISDPDRPIGGPRSRSATTCATSSASDPWARYAAARQSLTAAHRRAQRL
jgi:ribosomal protein L2